MSFVELDESPRKAELMQIARTIEAGMVDGDQLLRGNPVYIKQMKERQSREQDLWK